MHFSLLGETYFLEDSLANFHCFSTSLDPPSGARPARTWATLSVGTCLPYTCLPPGNSAKRKGKPDLPINAASHGNAAKDMGTGKAVVTICYRPTQLAESLGHSRGGYWHGYFQIPLPNSRTWSSPLCLHQLHHPRGNSVCKSQVFHLLLGGLLEPHLLTGRGGSSFPLGTSVRGGVELAARGKQRPWPAMGKSGPLNAGCFGSGFKGRNCPQPSVSTCQLSMRQDRTEFM